MMNLKFNTITVDKYYLGALESNHHGGFNIELETKKLSKKVTLIDKAFIELQKKYEELPVERKANIISPIYCLDSPAPIINNLTSFLVRNIPEKLTAQISSLKLENPLEIRTKIPGTSGAIGTTIIDITSEGILIIGNTEEAIEHLKLFGDRFYFNELSSSAISQQLKRLLTDYPKKILGSSMLIGGFGAIFSFVSAFLLNKAFTGDYACFEYVFASVISMLAIIFFLVEEAFENRIIAFTHFWALKPRIAAWILFLSFILAAPIGAFMSVPTKTVLGLMWICAILINIMCVISYLGQFFRGEGWSKGLAVFARILTAGLIWFLPFIKSIS